jgi:uncharacterized membrane protein
VVFAVLGLTPSLSWIPEIPLLLVAGLVPIVILTVTGYRAARTTGRIFLGLLSGAVAGAIGGTAGGVAYVIYGKPAVNIPIGLITGLVGGLVLGALGAVATRRRR